MNSEKKGVTTVLTCDSLPLSRKKEVLSVLFISSLFGATSAGFFFHVETRASAPQHYFGVLILKCHLYHLSPDSVTHDMER